MRKLLMVIILGGVSFQIIGQSASKWRIYVADDHSSIDKPVRFFLVKADQQTLHDSRIKVIRRLDEHYCIVRASSSMLGSTPHWETNNDWKISRDPARSMKQLLITTSEHFNPARYDVIHQYENVYLISTEGMSLAAIQNDPEVLSITNDIPMPTTEARVIDMNLNPNRVNKVHHEFPLLNGSSELVSIQENKYREDDIDLLGRNVITGRESEIVDNHADEMATIIAGSGNSFITGEGVARQANITSSNFFPVLPDPDSYYKVNEIGTQNHSYGIPQDTSYQEEAYAFDLSAFNNPNVLHVFSSGNEGVLPSIGGTYKGIEGYANLTGDIKMTKNSLVVGSVDTVGNTLEFVSRGPTYDGRVKPELVAYSVVGSSNSAALVSGVSTLLQQEYRESIGGTMPSALAKALLINAAKDVGGSGLDFITGYGSIDAYRSLQTLKNGQFFTGNVNIGETVNFDLNLPSNALNLKVTLVWTDPPANVGDAVALVNDLDLRLIDGSFNTTLPWVLNASPSVTSLSAPATRQVDRLNNVEQVTLTNPETSYTIEVAGFSVTGNQQFYVVYQFDLEDTFEWDFPTGSDNMPYNGETGSYFRWSTTLQGTALLEYSIDNGNTWKELDDDVPLERGYWRWNNPPLDGDAAIARMTIGIDQYETEVFTISAPLDASVGFNCGDSLMLRWNPIQKAVDYTVYALGTSSLEEISTVSDTFLVINNKSSLVDQRFTIQPNLEGGKNLLPAPTFDYTLQGVGCYVFSFFQTVALDTGIYLNLRLGTTYGIEEISFQRNINIEFEEIATVVHPQNDTYVLLDDHPAQGYNEHRAVITFQNGVQLELNAGSSYYLTEVPIRVFPNPVESGGYIDIITSEFEDRTPLFELIDLEGAQILSYEIEGSQDFIKLPLLDPGLYFYRLTADGNSYTGRIVIR